MMKLILYVAVLIVLFGTNTAIAQVMRDNLMPCTTPPVLILSACVYDGQRVLGGIDGRLGIASADGAVTWDCLPASFQINVLLARADTLLALGSEGQAWARIGKAWQRLPIALRGNVRTGVDYGGIAILTDEGEIARSHSVLGPYDVIQAPAMDGAWSGMDLFNDTIVVSGQRGTLSVSVDNGASWRQVQNDGDTLAWNAVHRGNDGTWWLAGDGARVGRIQPPFTTIAHIDTLFMPDPRDPSGAERRDGIDVVTSAPNGTIVVGGRTYPVTGLPLPEDHALFVLEPGAEWWRPITFEFATGIDPTQFFDVRCISVVQHGQDSMLVHTSVMYNGGSLTFHHMAGTGSTIAKSKGLCAGNAIERRDTLGKLLRYESLHYRSLARLDTSTIVVVRDHEVLLGELLATPTPSELVLLSMEPGDRQITSMQVRGPLPCTQCSPVRAFNGALFIGSAAGTYYTSRDTGRTWIAYKPDPEAGTIREVTGSSEALVLRAGLSRGRYRGTWSYAFPMLSPDMGERWFSPDINVPSHHTIRADAVGRTADGSVLIAATSFDTVTFESTQRLLAWDTQTESVVERPAPPEIYKQGGVLVLSQTDADRCVFPVLQGGDAVQYIGQWQNNAWTTFPLKIDTRGDAVVLPAQWGASRLITSPTVSVIQSVVGGFLTSSFSKDWTSIPTGHRLISRIVVDGIVSNDGLIVVGPMGQINRLYNQDPTTVAVTGAPTSTVSINGWMIDADGESSMTQLTDVAGRIRTITLTPDATGWTDVPEGLFPPGLYGAIIQYRGDIRRLPVLITR